PAWSRSVSPRLAPLLGSRWAPSAPIPRAPPVMNTTLSRSDIMRAKLQAYVGWPANSRPTDMATVESGWDQRTSELVGFEVVAGKPPVSIGRGPRRGGPRLWGAG